MENEDAIKKWIEEANDKEKELKEWAEEAGKNNPKIQRLLFMYQEARAKYIQLTLALQQKRLLWMRENNPDKYDELCEFAKSHYVSNVNEDELIEEAKKSILKESEGL